MTLQRERQTVQIGKLFFFLRVEKLYEIKLIEIATRVLLNWTYEQHNEVQYYYYYSNVRSILSSLNVSPDSSRGSKHLNE